MAIRDRILIIGNGFDLYHELPTKYVQFIQVLKNIELLEFSDSNEVLFEEIFHNVERKNQIIEKYDTKNIVFDRNYIQIIKNVISENKWYNLFRNKLEFENWIDFENEIKEALTVINKVIIKTNSFIEKEISTESINVSHLNISNAKLQIHIKEIEYLIKFGIIDKLSNNGALYVFNSDYFEKSNKFLIKFKSEFFFERIFEELTYFMNAFNDYLFKIVGVFYRNLLNPYSENLIDFDSKIDEYYNFNYTPSLENFYNVKKKVNYLHGRIEIINHNIVLGIDEVHEDLKNDKIFMFTKYYQKLLNNTDYQFLSNIKINSSKYEDNDKDFIIFGHSLADNDQNYLVELFNIGKQRQNTITIFFYNLNDKGQKLKNLLKIIGREDVEFLMKKKRLNFIPIDEKPFETVFNSLQKSYHSSWGSSEVI